MRIAPGFLLVGLLASGLHAEPGVRAEPGLHAEVATDLTTAASAWLTSLDRAQQRSALEGFDDAERFDLRLAPMFLEGLRRDELSPEQWQAWLGVLGTTLSEAGLRKVETIMSLEREVLIRDRRSLFGGVFGPLIHGEHRYYVKLFGEPRADAPWGMRFDGHHLSLNWTRAPGGGTALTPMFLGAEPREIAGDRDRAGLRALADEEDRGFALWSALDEEQRARSELEFALASGPGGGNRPLFLGAGGAPLDVVAPVGIAHSELDVEQRLLLYELVDAYLGNFRAEYAAQRRDAIEAAGRDTLHFAWAGNLAPGEPGYYRVQGPTLLIEWDDTMPEADHVHTIVREAAGDFGRDLLAEHYEREHGVAIASLR